MEALFTSTALVAIAEISDKAQVATIALGARYGDVLVVTAGTTFGMLLANVPVVLAGDALIKRVSLRAVRVVAAILFIATGAWMLLA